MSVKKKDNGKFEVRWREPGSRRNMSRTFDRKGDAEKWGRQKADEKDKLGLPADPRRMTFAELFEEKFTPNHLAMLEDSTQEMWRKRWLPTDRSLARGFKPKPHFLGVKWANYRLAEITFDGIKAWHGEMTRAGCSKQQMFAAHDALIAVLHYARAANIIGHNPAAQIKRPRYRAPIVTDPWLPDRIEAVRFALLDKAANGRRDFRWARARDATFVSVLAYCGLRTWDEAGAMEWDWIQKRTILVPDSKTHAARSVPLPEWVAEELTDWKLRSGLRKGLVFPRSPTDSRPVNHGTWQREVWANTIGQVLGEAEYKRPYHLRHSCISMWIEAGVPIMRIARQAGHLPAETLATYGHVFEDRDEDNPLDVPGTVSRVRSRYVQGGRGELAAGSFDVPAPREAHGAF